MKYIKGVKHFGLSDYGLSPSAKRWDYVIVTRVSFYLFILIPFKNCHLHKQSAPKDSSIYFIKGPIKMRPVIL